MAWLICFDKSPGVAPVASADTVAWARSLLAGRLASDESSTTSGADAASVLAKVSRDRLMVEMDAVHPGYGFAIHKGYSTPAHTAALAELGPCPEHRFSFANVRKLAANPAIGQRCRSG